MNQTTGQEVVEDTTTLDVGLVDAARDLVTRALGLVLVDAGSTVGSNAEGEGHDHTVDCGELHFDCWERVESVEAFFCRFERFWKEKTEKLDWIGGLCCCDDSNGSGDRGGLYRISRHYPEALSSLSSFLPLISLTAFFVPACL